MKNAQIFDGFTRVGVLLKTRNSPQSLAVEVGEANILGKKGVATGNMNALTGATRPAARIRHLRNWNHFGSLVGKTK